MEFTHFFWDFDGTLYDTYGRISRTAQKALKDLGVDVPIQEVYLLVKRSINNAYTHYAAPIGKTKAEFDAAYNAHANEEGPESMQPYPGIAELLASIAARGGRNYLYTHRDFSAWDALKRDGLDVFFTGGVTKNDNFPAKPAPDALNYLAEKYGLDKRQCVMIGDRTIDCEAGKDAGMRCILLDMENFYPDYQADARFETIDAMSRFILRED